MALECESVEGYVVAIKQTARSRNAAAGEWVADRGPQRTFRSKSAAKRWAGMISGDGSEVWIQDAVPWDEDPVDGYLVGGTRGGGAQAEPPGEQDDLADGD